MNRFIAFQLWKEKAIEYVSGDITFENTNGNFDASKNGKYWMTFHDVLPRRGPISPDASRFLDPSIISNLKNLHDIEPDPTRFQVWYRFDTDFYPLPNGMLPYVPPITKDIIGIGPITSALLVGREDEINIINQIWQKKTSARMVCFYGHGGVGKSSIVDKWLDELNRQSASKQKIFAYSFYGQGDEESVARSNDFFNKLCAQFGYPLQKNVTSADLGRRLARLIGDDKLILILDGLEPLQYGNDLERDTIRDPALSMLLKKLAKHNNGICIVTTRIAPPELVELAPENVIVHEVKGFGYEGAIQMLQSYNRVPTKNDTEAVTWLCERGADDGLTLKLVGRYAKNYLNSDLMRCLGMIAKFDSDAPIDAILNMFDEELTASSTAYQIMCMVSMFSRPASYSALQHLAKAAIPHLSDKLNGDLTSADSLQHIYDLRNLGLINPDVSEIKTTTSDNDLVLDAHPRVREFFASRMKGMAESAWKQGHKTLYEYYVSKVNLLRPLKANQNDPNSAKRLTVAYIAFAHCCHAGLYGDAYSLYEAEIRRDKQHFSWRQKGTVSEDLAALELFFKEPWPSLQENLTSSQQCLILRQTGLYLMALGQFPRAEESLRRALQASESEKEWGQAADTARNMTELFQVTGRLDLAHAYGSIATTYAKIHKSADSAALFYKNWAALAAVLHDLGEDDIAEAAFLQSQHWLTQTDEPPSYVEISMPAHYPTFDSFSGYAQYRYCDYLMDCGRIDQARIDVGYASGRIIKQGELLAQGLIKLAQGRIMIELNTTSADRSEDALNESLEAAWDLIDESIDLFHKANTIHHLPRGYLGRADVFRRLGSFKDALEDVDFALGISQKHNMVLYTIDGLLCKAEILLDKRDHRDAALLIDKAIILITEHKYHRRRSQVDHLYYQCRSINR